MPFPRQLHTLLMSFPPFALPSLDSHGSHYASLSLYKCKRIPFFFIQLSSKSSLMYFVLKLGLVYGGGFCLVGFIAAAVCFALFGGYFMKSKLVWNSQSYWFDHSSEGFTGGHYHVQATLSKLSEIYPSAIPITSKGYISPCDLPLSASHPFLCYSRTLKTTPSDPLHPLGSTKNCSTWQALSIIFIFDAKSY